MNSRAPSESRVVSSFIEQTGSASTNPTIPLKLHFTRITPTTKTPIASLAIVHGLGQYSELYYEFAQYFASFGYDCHLLDLRGFGYSGGVKGQSDFEDMIKDIELLFVQVRKDIPFFVCGHSLGASLLLSIGERNPKLRISGFIALAPLLDPDRRGYDKGNGVISRVTSYGVRFLGEFVGEILQSNWALQQNHKKGRNLMVRSIGLQMVKSLLRGIKQLNENAQNFKHPVFLLQGSSDCICNQTHLDNFYDTISSEDRAVQMFSNMTHEMVQDDEQSRVKIEMLAWMQLRLQTALPFSEVQINIKTYRQSGSKMKLLKMLATMIFAKTLSNISVFYTKGILFKKFLRIFRLLQSFLVF